MRAMPENLDDRASAPLDVAAHRGLASRFRSSQTLAAPSDANVPGQGPKHGVHKRRLFPALRENHTLTVASRSSRGVLLPGEGAGRNPMACVPLREGPVRCSNDAEGEGAALAIDARYRGAGWPVSTTRSC